VKANWTTDNDSESEMDKRKFVRRRIETAVGVVGRRASCGSSEKLLGSDERNNLGQLGLGLNIR
jgi:hypothetical protein